MLCPSNTRVGSTKPNVLAQVCSSVNASPRFKFPFFFTPRWQRCFCNRHHPLQKSGFYSPLPEVRRLQWSTFVTRWRWLFKSLRSRSRLRLLVNRDLLCLHSNNSLLNSKVVSVIVKPTPTLLSSPVEIEFPHLHNVSP